MCLTLGGDGETETAHELVNERIDAAKELADDITITKLFRLDREEIAGEIKCGGCNWENRLCYVLASTTEEAIKLLKDGDAGLCADCMADLLVDYGYEIKTMETDQ